MLGSGGGDVRAQLDEPLRGEVDMLKENEGCSVRGFEQSGVLVVEVVLALGIIARDGFARVDSCRLERDSICPDRNDGHWTSQRYPRR